MRGSSSSSGFRAFFCNLFSSPIELRLSFTITFHLPKAWNSSQGFTESKIKQAKIPKAADDPSANKKRKVTPSETSNNAASRGPWAPPSRSGVSTRLQSTGSSRGAEKARRELADLLA